jgi:hypothetical protein
VIGSWQVSYFSSLSGFDDPKVGPLFQLIFQTTRSVKIYGIFEISPAWPMSYALMLFIFPSLFPVGDDCSGVP